MTDDAPHRAAGHDDRALRTERPAGTDAHRARDRLEHRQSRLHAATTQKDCFHRLGDSVSSDSLRAKARHQTHDQSPKDRNEHAPPTQHGDIGRRDTRCDRPCIGEMSDQADQIEQAQSQERHDDAYDNGDRRKPKHHMRGGVVP